MTAPLGQGHIVGDCITVDGRFMRQRCSWCGEVLLDYDLARVAVPIGQEGPPATFPIGSIVIVDGNLTTVHEPERTADGLHRLLPNVCARQEADLRMRAE